MCLLAPLQWLKGVSFWQWVQVSGGCSLWKIVSGFWLLDEELGQSNIGVAIYENVRGKKKFRRAVKFWNCNLPMDEGEKIEWI